MFDKSTIKVYDKITAPKRLKNRVMDMEYEQCKTVFFKTPHFIKSFATCVIMIAILSAVFLTDTDRFTVYVSDKRVGNNPISISQQSNNSSGKVLSVYTQEHIVIPVKVKCNGNTEISVSQGSISFVNDETDDNQKVTVKSDRTIMWQLEKNDIDDNAVLEIKSKNRSAVYRIIYNSKSDGYRIKKENKDG